MTNVIVTGGAGFVGSHAAKALARHGLVPVVVDNLSRGHDWAVKWGPLERADLADAARLADVFARWRPAAVLHFAAFAYVAESVADPYAYYRNNIGGTLALLEAMRAAGCGLIVCSSTCAIYGAPATVPIPEDAPQLPVNPYGASKLAMERMVSDAEPAYGLRSVCLRYFNAGGSDPDGEIGEAHDPEPHIIPLALDVAAGRRARLAVYGTDYDTPDGSCVRDYVHVADLAEAHVLALRHLLEGRASARFNLGTGHGHSVLDVIRTAEAVTGRPIPYDAAPRRPGDPPILVADPARAMAALGWTPVRSGLDVQIRDAWAWRSGRPAAAREA